MRPKAGDKRSFGRTQRRNPLLVTTYVNHNGVKVAVRPSTDDRELGEDHMTVFARLARINGSTPGTANCMHNKPGERKKKGN